MTIEIKKQLSERLCRIADMMETCDNEDVATMRDLRLEHKSITDQLYPKTKEHEIPATKVKESRKNALEKAKQLLQNLPQSHKDSEKVLVWIGNVNGFPKEFTLEATDSFYASYSGNKYITAARSLVTEKQLKGYRDLERALLEVGLKLCSGRKEKQQFFNDYVVKYNEKLKAQRNG